jgi:hypothetical protein
VQCRQRQPGSVRQRCRRRVSRRPCASGCRAGDETYADPGRDQRPHRHISQYPDR